LTKRGNLSQLTEPALNVVTLSQLRARYWSKYKATLKLGHIRNKTEYYLIMGILNDLANSGTDSSRELLQALVVVAPISPDTR
ncbi:MAG: hypothetical protein ACRD9W_09680, partial [Terriglobia bacterium]